MKLYFSILLSFFIFSCSSDDEPSNSNDIPLRVIVDEVIVKNFSDTQPDGASWDFLDGADIYITLSKNGSLLFESLNRYDNATSGQSYSFDLNGETLNEPESTYELSLYDFDSLDEDDFIQGVTFTPWTGQSINDTTLTGDVGGFQFELKVRYEF